MTILEKTGLEDEQLRKQFLENKVPIKGTSNNYFLQAAIQCREDDLTKEQSVEKIQTVYDEWVLSKSFSKRPWSNILVKIDQVFKESDLAKVESEVK